MFQDQLVWMLWFETKQIAYLLLLLLLVELPAAVAAVLLLWVVALLHPADSLQAQLLLQVLLLPLQCLLNQLLDHLTGPHWLLLLLLLLAELLLLLVAAVLQH